MQTSYGQRKQHVGNRNGKKNEYMDIPRHNLAKFHPKRAGMTTKGKPPEEIRSLINCCKSNSISTNFIAVEIDNMQQNSKCRLCSDKKNR